MPRETPQEMLSRTPPMSWEREMPSRCASRSQMAFSSAALAMGLPRTARKMRGHSPPCSGDSAASMGPSSLTITCQAVSVDSPEKNGRSPAVHSPQPVSPSDCISASTILRLRVTPKLVSNGRTNGMCTSRRIMASILIRSSRSFRVKKEGPVRRHHCLRHRERNPLPPDPLKTPAETSVDSQTEHRKPVCELLRWPSTFQWRPEPEYVLRWYVRLSGAEPGGPQLAGHRAPTPPKACRLEDHPAVEMRIHHRNSRGIPVR